MGMAPLPEPLLLLSAEGEASALLPYQFHMEEIEGFRYRCKVRWTLAGGMGWGADRDLGPVPWLTPVSSCRTPCAQ